MRLYPAGAGESSGHWLATSAPLYMSGNVWYVHAGTGTDAASPAGQNREKPLATLAQAYTNAASGDMIVLKDGHAETITAALTISKILKIVGGGSSAGLPTVTLTRNHGTNRLLVVNVSDCLIGNIKFAADAQSNNAPMIDVAQTQNEFEDLYFVPSVTSAAECLRLSSSFGSFASIRNCRFVASGASTASQPYCAVRSTTATDGLRIEGSVFDGGTSGWSNFYALDLSAVAGTDVQTKQSSFLRGADVKIHASTTGMFNPQVSTGGPRVDW